MDIQETLPLSLRLEKRIGSKGGIFLCIILFILLFLPWLFSNQELFRQEGLYAASAVDYVDYPWQPSLGTTAHAHGVPHSDVWPLYPTMVSLLYRCGIPMENALRIISVTMLGILALITGLSAGYRCNKRAGIVAACCCFGTLFALEKGCYGGPETMTACFLLAAQLLFFHYGSRLADWNSAWISASLFLSLAFLTSGPVVLFFFVIPLLFLRRPLSFAGKFRTPGFLAGIILLLIVILTWALPMGLSLRSYASSAGWQDIFKGKYWLDVLLFPLEFPLRMLPWSLLMWMPFCVALQSISQAPVFSRYLRTLFFSMFALAWLIPGSSSKLIFFLIGPLSILTGLTYDLGIRRYGLFLRKVLIGGGIFFPAAALLIMGVTFLPENIITALGEPEKMLFRNEIPGYIWLALTAILVLTGLAMLYGYGIRRMPVWIQLFLICSGIAIGAAVEFLPYRMMEKNWRTLGNDVREVLPEDAGVLYKYNIDGMYCGLFYVKTPVYQLDSLNELDRQKETVYVISSGLPLAPDRVWTSLLPDNYTCNGVPVSVWRGVIREDDETWTEKSDE